MTRIAPDWLDWPETQAVIAALAPAEPRFVGGCVRDALIGRPGGDIDIAVRTPPAETMRLAGAAGIKAIPTGADHGVVTLVVDGRPFECATLRRDVETDGRRAVVAYAERVEEDAMRRDFTINALYAAPNGEVIDPTGEGLTDLAAMRLRFIGAPEARIAEDHLRILRYFRFHAQFGLKDFDPDALMACRAAATTLTQISAERITTELLKLLAASDPRATLAAMEETLAIVLPGAAPLGPLLEREAEMGLAPDPIRRLAATGAPADHLRLSKAQFAKLHSIRQAAASPLAEAAYRYGTDAARSSLAMAESPLPSDWRSTVAEAAQAEFPVKAADLIAAGVKPGPEIGAKLKVLEARWIAASFTLTKSELLDIA